MSENRSFTPEENPRVVRVTSKQLEMIEQAWRLISFHNPRRITGCYACSWFDWAVYHVTGIDVRDTSAYTFKVMQ